MNRRSLLLLGGAAAASIGGAVLLAPDTPTGPDPRAAGLAFPGLTQKLAGVMAIEIVGQAQKLELKRGQGEAWLLPAKGNYPARPDRVRELLVGLTELRLTEPRTANPELLGQLGLDDPAKPGSTGLLLRLLDGAGNPIIALVAGRRRMRTQGNVPEAIYVRRPGENQAWLAEGRLPVDADGALWLNRDIANLPRDRIRKVEIVRAGEMPITLTRTGDPDGRLLITLPGDAPAAEEGALDEVGRAFEFLTFTDVRAEAGLPGERIGQSRFELTDNLAITVRTQREAEAIWVMLAAEGDDEAARFNARWRGWAFQVGPWKEKAFLPRLEDLKRRELPTQITPPLPGRQP